ncbi:MAG: type ISP restriction/modification enzyme, partial [Parasphingorhabdus sp.]
FHLRGNQRTSGELSRKEGGKIFGSGSRAPIAISVFVKNPDAAEHGRIHFHDIGDYLDQKQKLAIVRDFQSVDGIARANGWKAITPDENNDWLDQVDRSFNKFIEIGSKAKDAEQTVFATYSLGVASGRDAWVYNSAQSKVANNIEASIEFYNSERERLRGEKPESRADLASLDDKKISWNRNAFQDLEKDKPYEFHPERVFTSVYRPFTPQWMYFERQFNAMIYQMHRIFPTPETDNLVLQVSGIGARNMTALMSKGVPCLDNVEKGQCFPLYLYEESKPDDGLFAADSTETGLTRRDAITDDGLAHFQVAYPGHEISKEDLFYYIYGLLHSPGYRTRFKNNLAKQLPRIPAVKSFDDFAAFRDAGRALGDLHVNFESADPYMVTFKEGDHRLIPEAQEDPVAFYRVKHTNKWKWGGKGKEKDLTTVIYNDNITMQNIPLEAYDYVVNGKPALEWVMERQIVKTDKKSGIVNDANDYANETVGNPMYPLELFQRVITVSLETMQIVRGLPKLDIDVDDATTNLDAPQTIDDIKRGIDNHWGDLPAAALALRVVDAVENRDTSKGNTLHVEDILEMLGVPEVTREIISALAILAQSKFAILRSSGEFIDEDGGRHTLPAEEFQKALDIGTITHPISQKEIAEAADKVVPVFKLMSAFFPGTKH